MLHPNTMKYYSQQDINICVVIDAGNSVVLPDCKVSINNNVLFDTTVIKSQTLHFVVGLLDPISIEVELKNKKYSEKSRDTEIAIKSLTIDNFELVPNWTYLACYNNDHNYQNPTSVLPFNGTWSIQTERPFYQWLHVVQKQGWLLEP